VRRPAEGCRPEGTALRGLLKHGAWELLAGPFCGKNEAEDSREDGKGNPEEAPAVIAAVEAAIGCLVNESRQNDGSGAAENGG
jgi:hypothetical protein